MFRNRIQPRKFHRFIKYALESRSDAPFARPVATSLPRGGFPKFSLFAPAENNGFRNASPLRRDPPVILTIGRTASKFTDKKCWNCKRDLEVKDFACAACNVLQNPPANVNFFQLVGMSQVYDIDVEELSKKFKNLQMIFHPDKFVNKSKEELEISETYSRLINKAYTTLKDPLARGFYLLELQKVPTEGNNLQQEFLASVLEKNEQLESLDKKAALSHFQQKNNEEIEKHVTLIKEAFRANQVNVAKMNLLKLNYFINLDNKIKEKLNDISTPKDA